MRMISKTIASIIVITTLMNWAVNKTQIQEQDATTRATFTQLGLKYPDAMCAFFDSVFYKS
jgi:hypothetical protein